MISAEICLERYMLVDSGADTTLIPRSVGKGLGFKIHEGEDIFSLGGISGAVPVVYRKLTIRLGEIELKIPVAWAMDENVPLLLGREVVFEKFDIEFRQAERKIIFRWREE